MLPEPDYTAAMRAARRDQRRWEAACAALTGLVARSWSPDTREARVDSAVRYANALVAAFERGEDGTT